MGRNRYAVGLQQTLTSTVDGATGTDAMGELLAAATMRPFIYDAVFGFGSTPVDASARIEVIRQTTSATGSAAQENAIDPGAPAAIVATEEEITAGPTVTANTQLLDFDLNTRATFRFVAQPDGELVIPATANNGLLFNASSGSYAGIARTTVHWEE